jgi:glycosyltransferase involved in cell wall biosynthesis
MDIADNKMILGYLSAAPRVSTQADAEASGPRAHVLGVINGFKATGWEVKSFIAGDRLPRSWSGQGSEKSIKGAGLRTLAADMVRLSLGAVNSKWAWNELGGQVTWVYERFAVLQTLGNRFKRQGVPWILETNALYFEEAADDRQSLYLKNLAKKKEIAAYQTCDALICVSQSLKNMILREAGLPDDKILVVPNGVDTNFFDPGKFPPRQHGQVITIGFVGHLYPWQGLDLLIRAIKDIDVEEGIKFHLDIIGEGPQRDELERLTSNLDLTSQVRFFGRVPWEEVPNFIAGFDIGYSNKIVSRAQASYFSPLKLYEYLAMAKPVLCSRTDGTSDVVRHLDTGFIFSAENKTELKNALRLIHESRDKLLFIGEHARQEAVNCHSWNQRVRMMCAGIERILGELPK